MWPRARPLIIGTHNPQAAAIGATRKLVLSPTPPVECLSTATLPSRWGENFSPESRMARVSARVSSRSSPRRKAAISQAESCSGGIDPSAAPETRKPISHSFSAPPSRFLRIRSITCKAECGETRGKAEVDEVEVGITAAEPRFADGLPDGRATH